MKKVLVLVLMFLALSAAIWAGGAKEDSSKPITFVWLPNDSVPEGARFRAGVDKIIADATGRRVVDKLTTDYNSAVEAMATDNGGVAYFGAYQYVLAHAKCQAVIPLVTNTGDSGTMADAVYHSRLVVRAADDAKYLKNGSYMIDGIQGSKFSFVSKSSTSGFLFPASGIVAYFSKMATWSKLTEVDLIEGGSDRFFGQVLFGVSHQGSVINLLTGKVDVAAADDVDLQTYVKLISGKENEPGSTYEVIADAPDPFRALAGQRFTVIWSVPVLNGPITANTNVLGKETLQKIVAAFTADSVMTNSDIFVQPGRKNKSDWKQTGKVRFVAVTDATYQPVREKIK